MEESVEVDAELPHDYPKPELDELVERFEPYCEDNAPIVFLARKAPIADAQLVGKCEQNHLKLTLNFGKHTWPALFKGGTERLERDFSFRDRDSIDLVFKATITVST
jgi:single-stranded-DNA-specific exonuclease